MQEQNWDLESGDCIQKETSSSSQTPSSSILSSSFLRRRPNQERPPVGMFKQFLNNLRLVFLGTKLCVLIPAIPLAILGQCYGFMTRVSWDMCNYSGHLPIFMPFPPASPAPFQCLSTSIYVQIFMHEICF